MILYKLIDKTLTYDFSMKNGRTIPTKIGHKNFFKNNTAEEAQLDIFYFYQILLPSIWNVAFESYILILPA